jgi:energy-coupling factor transporter ATP-binding protein EcfA2
MPKTYVEISEPRSAQPIRPSISFETITFSDGQTLSFDDDEIVVFVGPNNSGKSASLRELQSWISRSAGQTVIVGATLKKLGSSSDLRAYLEKNSVKSGDTANLTYSGIGYGIHHSHLHYFDQTSDRHPVAPFFSAHIATETRITASDPAGAIALHQQPPSNPIHLMLMDPSLAQDVSKLFRNAFGEDLIVFRAGGSSFPLFVGTKPVKLLNEDELDKTYIERLLRDSVPLQKQGDGMRSFATILLHVLVADNHTIQFLDEPEAFLHPPQARLLGEYIAQKRRAKSQLFIATHSTDILDGLMAGGTSKIRIIRIRRDGKINRVTELSRGKTVGIANDALTRYSGVFKGIFYKHVMIAESDGDCQFYSSLLNLKSIAGDMQPDVLFIHAAGKHRMAQLAETLKSLDVPVSVIADIDILNEENTFKRLFETLGGIWDSVEPHWRAIKTGVEAQRPPMNSTQIKDLILKELDEVDGLGGFPKQSETAIRKIFQNISPWDPIKQSGRSALRGPSVNHFDQLSLKCGEIGLWIVPVGELEGFCRSIEAKHGPDFVEKVLEQRNVETDEELKEARTFIAKVWTAAGKSSVRVESAVVIKP